MANTNSSVSVSSLFTVSANTASVLNDKAAKAAAKAEFEARFTPQTVASLEKTFSGITEYMDRVIVAFFVSAGIVDGNMFLDSEGNGTNDEEAGVESNPAYMTIIADGRTAWFSLELINEELYQVTNNIWSSRDKAGSLTLLGFNDGSEGAVHGDKRFTVTEAGALATLVFGTRDDRSTGLFFKSFIVQAIKAQHESYLGSDEAKAVAEKARIRNERIAARRAEEADYHQFKSAVPEVTTTVIPADLGLSVTSKGSLRIKGRFVKKNTTLVK